MGKESFALLIHGGQPNAFRSKSAYQVAKMVEKYLKRKWADDIQARGGDAPKAYGKKRWAEIGLGGGDGAGIIWEGFYEWTKPVEMFFIEIGTQGVKYPEGIQYGRLDDRNILGEVSYENWRVARWIS